MKSHSFATLFSEFAVILRHPLSTQLFSPLPCSSQLFSTTLTSAHLAFTLLNMTQLVSPLATSTHSDHACLYIYIYLFIYNTHVYIFTNTAAPRLLSVALRAAMSTAATASQVTSPSPAPTLLSTQAQPLHLATFYNPTSQPRCHMVITPLPCSTTSPCPRLHPHFQVFDACCYWIPITCFASRSCREI